MQNLANMVKTFNTMKIAKLCSNKEKLMDFLIDINLLKYYGGICPKCSIGTIERKYESKVILDKRAWRCNKKKCRKFISIRKNSIFEFSNLKLKVFILVFFGITLFLSQ